MHNYSCVSFPIKSKIICLNLFLHIYNYKWSHVIPLHVLSLVHNTTQHMNAADTRIETKSIFLQSLIHEHIIPPTYNVLLLLQIVLVTGALRPVDFTRDFSVLNTQSRLIKTLYYACAQTNNDTHTHTHTGNT